MLWVVAFEFLLGILSMGIEAATEISSARVWPAPDYTRITLESPRAIQHQMLQLTNPERLVIDLEDTAVTPALMELAAKVAPSDPYVKTVRVGRFKPGVVRLVFDLKTDAKPQLFLLPPIAEYGHRLVLDIYPLRPPDPLLALLEKTWDPAAPAEAPTSASSTPYAKGVPSEAAVGPPAPPAPSVKLQARAPKLDTRRLIIVAIDPGHGGEDPGAIGRRGTQEKDVTLAIALVLKTMIDHEPNMRAILTREGDYFIPLATRVNKARRVNADLFVSIHADAFIKPHARGSSVFALSESGATSAAARWLAKKENEADLIGGINLDVTDPYLKRTLIDLSQTAAINDSLKLGKSVLSELSAINTLHKSAVEQAGFAVLKAPDIPSILVETAFISNPEEEKKLSEISYQEKMAAAILSGIKRYFARNPPLARAKFASNP